MYVQARGDINSPIFHIELNVLCVLLILGPEERETLVAVISVQGKKGAKDYADNYCVEKHGPLGIQNITQDFSSCLVRMLRNLTSSYQKTSLLSWYMLF